MKPALWRQIPGVAVMAVSVAVSLLGTEAVLRWTKTPDHRDLSRLRLSAARRQGIPFDTRTTLEVLEDLRQQGERAFPPIKPFNFLDRSLAIEEREVLPLAGIADVVTVFNANETGERFVYRSDEYGFHNPLGMHLGGAIEIAVIGDSYAQGVAVRSGQGLAEQLRRVYPQTLNLGMGASGPLVELAILREYAQPLRPRIVLWLYFEGNDLSDATKEARNSILREYLDGAREPSLRELAAPLDEALIRFADELLAGHKARLASAPEEPSELATFLALTETRRRFALARSGIRPARSPAESVPDGGFVLFRRALRQARSWTEDWGGRFVLVYLPEFARFSKRSSLRAGSLQRAEVLAFLEQEGFAVIDLVPVFLEHKDPRALFPFSLTGHYNAEGCRRLADAIVSELSRRDLDPAKTWGAEAGSDPGR